jgi:hypothetical protein
LHSLTSTRGDAEFERRTSTGEAAREVGVGARCLGTAPGGGVNTRRPSEDETLLAGECPRASTADVLIEGRWARSAGLTVCEGGSGTSLADRTDAGRSSAGERGGEGSFAGGSGRGDSS